MQSTFNTSHASSGVPSVWEGFYVEPVPSSAGSVRLAPLPFKAKGLRRLKEENRQQCTNRLFYGDCARRRELQKTRDTFATSQPLSGFSHTLNSTTSASASPSPSSRIAPERLTELSSPKHPPRPRPNPTDKDKLFATSLYDPHLRTFWMRKGILVDRLPRPNSNSIC